jgi:serine/threonine-protein kinase RsbW
MGADGPNDGKAGSITLEVPARPEYVHLVRLNASGLASRQGFSYEEVEDIRLAIDELCFTLIGPQGRHGTVRVTYREDGDGLEVDGVGMFDDPDPPDGGLSGYSQQILAALVDDYSVDADDGSHSFRLRKRPAQPVEGRGR